MKKAIKNHTMNAYVIGLALSFLTLQQWSCHGLKPAPTAELRAVPDKVAITKALLKKPVQFRGTGYAPEEHIIVDMMIPKGVKIKKASDGLQSVQLAYAVSDENGNFKATMGARETLSLFFQVGWTADFKPIFEDATPLPPGEYEIYATGKESDAFGVTRLIIVPSSNNK